MDDGTQRHYYWQKVGLSAGFLKEIEVKVGDPALDIKGSLDGRARGRVGLRVQGHRPQVVRAAHGSTGANPLPPAAGPCLHEGTGHGQGVGDLRATLLSVDWHEFRVRSIRPSTRS